MLENVHWLGHDSFRLDGSVTVYVDPWKLPAGQPPAGLILVTHDHFDHLSLPDIAALAGPDTVVVGPASVTGQVSGLTTVTVAPGDSVEVAGLPIEAVAAYNLDKFRAPGQPFHPKEAGYVGYVVTLDGARYYHAGDTDAIPEMRDIRADVALLPVSGTYVMTCEEACGACDLITAQAAVPMHYADIVGDAGDAERFRAGCSIPVTILPLEK
ncbi:MAG TPA: MBL fold metallo-hydrolase [Thermoleophilia bacterium]|nr:MBL fold metallo-hydrolase [Thermoleophilia bacterium]